MHHLQRKGYPMVSQVMMEALQRLHASRDDFIKLDGVHGKTIRYLREKDLLMVSQMLGEPTYKITGRGIHVYEFYSTPLKRRDGICPSCQTNPRIANKSYCVDCMRTFDRKHYKNYKKAMRKVGSRNHRDKPCACCHINPRYTYCNGEYVMPYCRVCLTEKARVGYAKRNKRKLSLIETGVQIMCTKCNARPVLAGDKFVNYYCAECDSEIQRQKRLKAKQKHFANKIKHAD